MAGVDPVRTPKPGTYWYAWWVLLQEGHRGKQEAFESTNDAFHYRCCHAHFCLKSSENADAQTPETCPKTAPCDIKNKTYKAGTQKSLRRKAFWQVNPPQFAAKSAGMETEIAQFQCACFSNKCSNNIFGPGLFQLLIVDVSIAILRWIYYNNAATWWMCVRVLMRIDYFCEVTDREFSTITR